MMAALQRRYGRQIRLREIGEAGQRKLCAAEVDVAGEGHAAEIEARYLRAAGLRPRRVPGARAPAAEDLGVQHPAAREVLEGSLRALSAIRAVLGLAPAEVEGGR